ncbi:hypothetical protein TSUD_362670 [Trifolium subterraneum]|uniref:Response regulatory domain-containing protein n=1 Tax=Trifolium subterraneum TaxID=3900 RepID=A0A2Z6PB31_TRISU|nr:hypothetical protein TSUD_362670 [Trifolium subterraneum]
MESDEPQSAELRKYTRLVAGVKVLVVDANSTCQAVISKLLLSLVYEVLVTTATLAYETLSIIGEKKNEINLVHVEAQLPDMEIYELIEKMKSSNIQSFVMTAYDEDIPPYQKNQVQELNCDLESRFRFLIYNSFRSVEPI